MACTKLMTKSPPSVQIIKEGNILCVLDLNNPECSGTCSAIGRAEEKDVFAIDSTNCKMRKPQGNALSVPPNTA